MAGTAIVVASVPAAHPYVQHLARVAGPDPVRRLPDPPPLAAYPQPGQWWPPAMLSPEWVERNWADFDVLHLHFGFDVCRPDGLRTWLAALRRHGRPLVLTVHDLVNPHFVDQRDHLANLDVLIPAADAVLTLTGAAARAIEQRWRIAVTVVPHPHIVPLGHPLLASRHPPGPAGSEAVRPRNPGREFVIGLHCKSLRTNVDPLPVLDALAAALPELPSTVVQVDLHPELLERTDDRAVALRTWLDSRAGDPSWRVLVRPRMSDDQLYQALRELDLYVLPYRFGTHSGWLEACVDLGTGVLVPRLGCFADQHGHPSFHRDDDEVDHAEFFATLRAIRADPALATPGPPDRAGQREWIAAEHERVYRSVLGRG